MSHKDSFFISALNTLRQQISVIDRTGQILWVNQAWREFAICNNGNRYPTALKENYIEVCRRAARSGDDLAAKALHGIQSLINNHQAYFELEYPCHSPSQERWFMMSISPLVGDEGIYYVDQSHGYHTTQRDRIVHQSSGQYR